MKLYCLFLKSNITLFDVSNKLLQNEKPCIHLLHEVLVHLFEKLICKFVKASVISNTKSIISVDFQDRDNQKDDVNLFIGSEAKTFIEKYGSILNLEKFYSSVRIYYITICSYMVKKFPFINEVLVNAAVANISKKTIFP